MKIKMRIVCIIALVVFGTMTYGNVNEEGITLKEVLVNNIKEEEYSGDNRTTGQMIYSGVNMPQERTTPCVISVDIPTHINMTIDPYEKMRSGAVVSEEIKITNYSEVTIDINLVSFQVVIPEQSQIVYTGLPLGDDENKNLGLYLWNIESKKQFNLYENMNVIKIDTLAQGQVNTYMIKGEVNNTNVNWSENDRINTEIIFNINAVQ